MRNCSVLSQARQVVQHIPSHFNCTIEPRTTVFLLFDYKRLELDQSFHDDELP